MEEIASAVCALKSRVAIINLDASTYEGVVKHICVCVSITFMMNATWRRFIILLNLTRAYNKALSFRVLGIYLDEF